MKILDLVTSLQAYLTTVRKEFIQLAIIDAASVFFNDYQSLTAEIRIDHFRKDKEHYLDIPPCHAIIRILSAKIAETGQAVNYLVDRDFKSIEIVNSETFHNHAESDEICFNIKRINCNDSLPSAFYDNCSDDKIPQTIVIKYTYAPSDISCDIPNLSNPYLYEFKLLVQHFAFGQHNKEWTNYPLSEGLYARYQSNLAKHNERSSINRVMGHGIKTIQAPRFM